MFYNLLRFVEVRTVHKFHQAHGNLVSYARRLNALKTPPCRTCKAFHSRTVLKCLPSAWTRWTKRGINGTITFEKNTCALCPDNELRSRNRPERCLFSVACSLAGSFCFRWTLPSKRGEWKYKLVVQLGHVLWLFLVLVLSHLSSGPWYWTSHSPHESFSSVLEIKSSAEISTK